MGEEVKVAIRADASVKIGTGHVMRCLALAEELRENGAQVTFISRDFEGNLFDFVQGKGFEQIQLKKSNDQATDQITEQTATEHFHSHWLETSQEQDLQDTKASLVGVYDWLIADHYALSAKWHLGVKDITKKLFVIDDLADRPLVGDILLDQNYNPIVHARYPTQWTGPQMLLGPQYALLRKEFLQARAKVKVRESVSKVLVTFGGVDSQNFTAKVLDVLRETKLKVTAVLPQSSSSTDENIHRYSRIPGWTLLKGTDRMAELISNADLCIGATGSSNWERFSLGLPSIVYALAENQVEIAKAISQKGWAVYAGMAKDFSAAELLKFIQSSIANPKTLSETSQMLLGVVDAQGCRRVVEAMMAASGQTTRVQVNK